MCSIFTVPATSLGVCRMEKGKEPRAMWSAHLLSRWQAARAIHQVESDLHAA
jgi:hypothetical protein